MSENSNQEKRMEEGTEVYHREYGSWYTVLEHRGDGRVNVECEDGSVCSFRDYELSPGDASHARR